ncbi:MAG: hypothetical protein GKR90_19355 [Pseudomonadales bacterium]|nr:hypothetical protein [Pseudomonadales bacterium]
MKFLKIGAIVLLVVGVIAAIAAPLGPMPGLLIGGTDSEVPSSWGDTKSIDEIHLQIGVGPIGRTVIIWTVQVDGDLYVTGQKDSGWTQGIGSGGPVRLRMADKLYELNASPVTENQVEILNAWLAKYAVNYPEITSAFPDPEESLQTSALFRLSARS